MASIKKPDSVEIIIRNRKKNIAKSFTVYNITIQEAYERIKRLFTK